MHKWVVAVMVVFALAFAGPAHAIVQETNTTVTNTAPEIKETTLTIEQPGRPAQTVRVTGTRPKTQPVKIDPDKPVTVTARSSRVDGRAEPERKRTVEGAIFLRDGIDLGGGLALTSVPARTGRARSAPVVPATTTPQRSFIDMAGFSFGRTGVAVDVGLTGGGTFRSTSGSFVEGIDNFLGTHLTDRRPVDVGGDSGFIGGMVNVWQMSPGQRWFFQTGVNVPVSSSSSAQQTGMNTGALGGANGDVTFKVKYDWVVPVFVGISGPISSPYAQMIPLQDPRWRIGGGGNITHSSLSISGVDGPARTPFSASKSFTDFDPGFLVGLRGGMGAGWIFGADLMVTWRGDKDVTAGSNTPGFVQTHTGHLDGGVDTTFQLSVSRTLGGPATAAAREWPRDRLGNPIVFSDIRLKRDLVPLARLDSGLGLYRYRYTWSDQLYVGVMAQEVSDVVPDAVVKGDDGYLRVNYARLGTSMKTWEQWTAEHGWLSREAD